MKLATTTSDFDRFLTTYQEKTDCVIEAGFKYVDLSLYEISKDDDLLISSKWQDNAKRLLENTTQKGACFVQAHSPGGNPISGDAASERLIEATIRSIEVCGALGIKNTVVHGGFLEGIDKKHISGKIKTFLKNSFRLWKKTT